MAEETISSLGIELHSNFETKGIDALVTMLERLKDATKGGLGITKIAKDLNNFNSAAANINEGTADKIEHISKAVNTLSSIKTVKISSTIATQISAIGVAAKSLDNASFLPLSELTNALKSLTDIKNVSLNGVINQLSKMPDVAKSFDGVNTTMFTEKIKGITDSLKPLEAVGKQTISSALNQLKKIPDIAKELEATDVEGFARQIQKVTDAVKPLADEMNKVSAGFSAFPAKIQKLITNTDSLAVSNNKAAKSFTDLYHKIKVAMGSVKAISSHIASSIVKMNDYIENVNLFNVSMGKYAGEAKDYAEQVGSILGIDPGEWMRYQGVFMTLATGFGVAGDNAYTMSKNLTQLGYDMASFFNLPFEESMQKLQSAFAGELEPVRRVGYDLSKAALEKIAMDADNYTVSMGNLADAMSDAAMSEYALANGITKSFNEMTQAEKSQLRYIALMKQVTVVQGDMSRTLDAPANQLRVFQSQVTQASRAIGSVFIPALNAVLPYATAFVEIVGEIAGVVASLFGFEMPKVDYSDIDTSIGDIGQSADDSNKKIKQLKASLLGIDELNILGSNNNDNAGIGNLLGQLDFRLPTYDFIGEATKSRIAEIVEDMKEWLGITGEINSWADLFDTKLGRILELVGFVGAGFGVWKISESLIEKIKIISSLGTKNFSIGFSVIGAVEFFDDLKRLKDYVNDFLENGASFDNVSGMISSFTEAIGDALVVLGKTDVGAALTTIGSIVGIINAVYDIAENGVNWDNAMKAIEELSGLFTSIGLLTKNKELTGASLIIKGATTAVNELRKNWDAIKQGDWSGVDKATLAISAIEVVGGILTAFDVFAKIKGAIPIGNIAPAVKEATDTIGAVNNSISPLPGKLGSLAKNLGLGIAIIAEVIVAAGLIVGAIWALGKGLNEVGKAWQPVIENGNTVAIAMGIGIGILVAIGVVTGLLGSIGTPLIAAIGLGTAILVELGIAAGVFIVEIWAIGKGLNEIGKSWQPVLKNGENIKLAIEIGTGLLVGIGVVTAALGAATVASAGLLPVAIGLGTALLIELGEAFILLVDELIKVSDQLTFELHPTLFNFTNILPGLSDDMESFTDFMGIFAGHVVDYSKNSAIAGIASTISSIISFFTKDPIKSLADDVEKQYNNVSKLREKLRTAVPEFRTATELLDSYCNFLEKIDELVGQTKNISLESGISVNMKKVGEKLVTGFVDGIKNKKKDLNGGVESVLTGALTDKIAKSYGSSFGKKLGEKIVEGFKQTKIPKIEASIDASAGKGFLQLGTYASGGFPDEGQMFIARENGPEMVGSIGNRTAVANNTQIVEAIKQGVKEAMSESGNSNGGGDWTIQILDEHGNITGQTVITAAQRLNQRAGKTVMPLGV